MVSLPTKQHKRFESKKIIWMATTKPNSQPHLVPVWFVLSDGNIFVWTKRKSVKARNLRENPRITIALETGSKPLIGEGRVINSFNPADILHIIDKFSEKYDWSNYTDTDYDIIFEIEIMKWIHFND